MDYMKCILEKVIISWFHIAVMCGCTSHIDLFAIIIPQNSCLHFTLLERYWCLSTFFNHNIRVYLWRNGKWNGSNVESCTYCLKTGKCMYCCSYEVFSKSSKICLWIISFSTFEYYPLQISPLVQQRTSPTAFSNFGSIVRRMFVLLLPSNHSSP
jgi:hypothetical protein